MGFRNQEHYEKVKTSLNDSVKPFFNKSNWLVYSLMAILTVAIAPFVTVRRSHIVPSSPEIYFHQVEFFAGALFLLMLPLLWIMQFKPYFEMKSGYHYVGRFEIIDKRQLLGYCFLLLFPGRSNWIKVSQKIFHATKIGETIELKRAFFGSVNRIRILRNIRQRIKGNYYNKCRKGLVEGVS